MTGRSYQRKFYRFTPDRELHADISIVRVGKRDICTGAAKVNVLNLSTGGIRFTCGLVLPPDSTILYEFALEAPWEYIRAQGYIVHGKQKEPGIWEYGASFTGVDDRVRTYMSRLFRKISVQMKNCMILLKLE